MQFSNALYIDCSKICANFERISRTLPEGTLVMPMLKANGYGVGDLQVARLLSRYSIPFIGVSWIEEAFSLRERGYDLPIFSLSCTPGHYQRAAELSIDVGLSDFKELALMQRELKTPLNLHIHYDTGMHRLGLSKDELNQAFDLIQATPQLNLVGLMSHFSASSNPLLRSYSLEQKKAFSDFVRSCPVKPRWIHMGSSNSLLPYPQSECNLVRLGHLFFGVDPTVSLELENTLTLKSQVISTHTIRKGESVGYDSLYVEKREKAKIAVLSMGYHDGLHLEYSQKGHVYLKGKKAPYVGRICMDFFMVDITHIDDVQLGDEAEIFGPHIPLKELASWGYGSFRQMMACLGPRIKRVYLNTGIDSYDQETALSKSVRPFKENESSLRDYSPSGVGPRD